MITSEKTSLMRLYNWIEHHISELGGAGTGVGIAVSKVAQHSDGITGMHILQVALFGFIGGAGGFLAKELGAFIKNKINGNNKTDSRG